MALIKPKQEILIRKDLEIDKQVRFLSLAPPSGQFEIFQVKSYFGGFLCCAWSPSGRFLAVGGEDDLITVMSPDSGKIICRCQGHRPGFIHSVKPLVENR